MWWEISCMLTVQSINHLKRLKKPHWRHMSLNNCIMLKMYSRISKKLRKLTWLCEILGIIIVRYEKRYLIFKKWKLRPKNLWKIMENAILKVKFRLRTKKWIRY